jgi:hypothetical protein
MPKYFDISPFLQEATESLQRGESLRMVAKKIGITHITLSQKLKENGVEVPTKAMSAKNTWKNHQHPRLGKKGRDCPVYGKKMSASCREKMEVIWKTQADNSRKYRKKHSGGYIMIYLPDHPYADRSGYVLEHRSVMESHIGRYLTADEIVHHINGNKEDNRLENLALLSREEHAKIHKSNTQKEN